MHWSYDNSNLCAETIDVVCSFLYFSVPHQTSSIMFVRKRADTGTGSEKFWRTSPIPTLSWWQIKITELAINDHLVGGLEHFSFFIIFPYAGNNNPNWLLFFRWVETTNQPYMLVTGNKNTSFSDTATFHHWNHLGNCGFLPSYDDFPVIMSLQTTGSFVLDTLGKLHGRICHGPTRLDLKCWIHLHVLGDHPT